MSSSPPSTRDRLRYAFDNLMSRGTPALIGLLAVVTLGFILVWLLVVTIFALMPADVAGEGFREVASRGVGRQIWYALMRAMDAGTLGGDDGGWPFLIANLGITIAGIFVLSALIGVLNAGLEGKLEELRRGRSVVIEREHTLVIGWNASIFTVLEELITANANRKDACIVVLSSEDKTVMEEAIRERIVDPQSTRIVCRSGSPTEPADLEMVGVDFARAVLLLAPERPDADIQVIKAMLAILHDPNRRQRPHHLVAELRHEKNYGIAKMVGRGEAEIVVASDLISRITVQTCRQSGLSVVHTELLDFGGDEIYFADTDQLVGMKFGDVLQLYRSSSVIGLVTHDGPSVLPDLDQRIEPGDRIIAISADDDTVVPTLEPVPIDEAAIVAPPRAPASPEKTLLLGWNERARGIVRGLDAYVAAGSTMTVVALEGQVAEVHAILPSLERTAVTVVPAEMSDREVLDRVDAPSFDHVIVLSSDELDAEASDARVLVTLLHLREIGEQVGKDLAIVSEIRDVRNRRLAEVTDADDFIVSDKLVSLMMCQIAENKELHGVLADLFDPDGGEIYMRPATDYVAAGSTVSYATIVESARRRGEIAIGFRLNAEARSAETAYGVRVNPPKVTRVTLSADDKVIVVAQE